MSSSDMHDAVFKWPHTEPSDVIVTGSFDGWSRTIHLSRTPYGFAATVKVPWGQKISYKYIVDGRWTTTDTQPTELDPMNNINNVYNAPARPIQPQRSTPPAVIAPFAVFPSPPKTPDVESAGKVNGVLAVAKGTATGMVEAIAPGTTEQSPTAEVPAAKDVPNMTQTMKSIASTATETAASAASATVSAVNAAAHAVTETITKDESTPEESTPAVGEGVETSSDPAEHEVSSQSVLPSNAQAVPVAPIVPVPILPLSNDQIDSTIPHEDSTSEPLPTVVVDGDATPEGPPVVPSKDVSTHAPVIANGEATTSEPTAVPLPAVTPSEIPGTNGDHTSAPTVESTAPVASPSPSRSNTTQKEKRMNFPTLGRNHRHSSSGSTSERSEASSAKDTVSSRMSSQRKKRTSSIFGKIKDIFHHHHHEDHKGKTGEK